MVKKGLTFLGFVLFLPFQIYASNGIVTYCFRSEKYLMGAFFILAAGGDPGRF